LKEEREKAYREIISNSEKLDISLSALDYLFDKDITK
jgi:hypothetical protein